MQKRRWGRAHSEAEYRLTLERTIEESDALIRTFNALLMIARADSARVAAIWPISTPPISPMAFSNFYEPLAEDNGLTLRLATSRVPMHGNRELISQALAIWSRTPSNTDVPHHRRSRSAPMRWPSTPRHRKF